MYLMWKIKKNDSQILSAASEEVVNKKTFLKSARELSSTSLYSLAVA